MITMSSFAFCVMQVPVVHRLPMVRPINVNLNQRSTEKTPKPCRIVFGKDWKSTKANTKIPFIKMPYRTTIFRLLDFLLNVSAKGNLSDAPFDAIVNMHDAMYDNGDVFEEIELVNALLKA